MKREDGLRGSFSGKSLEDARFMGKKGFEGGLLIARVVTRNLGRGCWLPEK